MLTCCSRAVNFSFPSFRAVSRTRSSPLGPLSPLGDAKLVLTCTWDGKIPKLININLTIPCTNRLPTNKYFDGLVDHAAPENL